VCAYSENALGDIVRGHSGRAVTLSVMPPAVRWRRHAAPEERSQSVRIAAAQPQVCQERGIQCAHLVEPGAQEPSDNHGYDRSRRRRCPTRPAGRRSSSRSSQCQAIQAVGIGNRQGLQHHGMNEREDGCGRADAEAEAEHDGDRQYRTAPHLTQAYRRSLSREANMRWSVHVCRTRGLSNEGCRMRPSIFLAQIGCFRKLAPDRLLPAAQEVDYDRMEGRPSGQRLRSECYNRVSRQGLSPLL
jgi:hypothetical protein